MMDRWSITTLVFGILFCAQVFALDKPWVSLSYETGAAISPPADVTFGDRITIKCSFTAFDGSGFYQYSATLRTKNESGGVEDIQAQCLFRSDPNNPIVRNTFPPNSLGIDKDNGIRCDPNLEFAEFTFALPLSLVEIYDCQITDGSLFKASDETFITAHSIPSNPIITFDPSTPTEGKALQISCTSRAHPPPKLILKVQGVERAKSDDLAVDPNNLMQQNSVSMEIAPSDRTSNGDEVTCEVDRSHPSNREVSSSKRIRIIFGPDSAQTDPAVKEHNINAGDMPPLDCKMEAYPPLNYKWLHNDKEVGTGAFFIVTSEFYKDAPEYPYTLDFVCVGTNPNTSAEGRMTFTVKLDKTTDKDNGGGNTGETGDPEDSGLKDAEIVGIVIGAIVFLVILTFIIVCLVKRNRNMPQSAKKTKAAQARRFSDERADASRFQSTSSFGLQHMGGNGNYSENPTLPMEHRYGNVEQYAEVIDDRPRSRKPIALDEMDMYDSNMGPSFEEAPPAYTDMNSPYGSRAMDPNYATYSSNYGSSYGAAC